MKIVLNKTRNPTDIASGILWKICGLELNRVHPVAERVPHVVHFCCNGVRELEESSSEDRSDAADNRFENKLTNGQESTEEFIDGGEALRQFRPEEFGDNVQYDGCNNTGDDDIGLMVFFKIIP